MKYYPSLTITPNLKKPLCTPMQKAFFHFPFFNFPIPLYPPILKSFLGCFVLKISRCFAMATWV